MNSSISSSERDWRRFLRLYAATLLIVGLGSYAFVLVMDPYNTGMLTPLDRNLGIHDSPRMADVGRGRNPDFDSAIFGNSTGQLIDPERLGTLMGGRFVSLIIPGSGPVEQLVMMDYFLRHHPGGVRTLVVTMDTLWCTADRVFSRERILNPFPFWLYDGDRVAYAARVVTLDSIKLSRRKLNAMFGDKAPYRADGYENFELGRMWRIDEAWARLGVGPMNWMIEADRSSLHSFAALDALETRLAQLGPQVRLVLAFMPYYAAALPAAGSLSAERLDGCKARAAQVAAAHGAAYLDFLQDDRLTRDAANFWDPLHYRSHIARAIEYAIAEARKG
jgi:hypothetical protein